MANTKITDLGDRRIAISGRGDMRKPAFGNGTVKPGDLVGISGSTSKVVPIIVGTSELFGGIVDDDPKIAENTAIEDGKPLSVIVPTSGGLYRVKIEDPQASKAKGTPMGFSSTAGCLEFLATLGTAGAVGYLESSVVSGDTVAMVRWK